MLPFEANHHSRRGAKQPPPQPLPGSANSRPCPEHHASRKDTERTHHGCPRHRPGCDLSLTHSQEFQGRRAKARRCLPLPGHSRARRKPSGGLAPPPALGLLPRAVPPNPSGCKVPVLVDAHWLHGESEERGGGSSFLHPEQPTPVHPISAPTPAVQTQPTGYTPPQKGTCSRSRQLSLTPIHPKPRPPLPGPFLGSNKGTQREGERKRKQPPLRNKIPKVYPGAQGCILQLLVLHRSPSSLSPCLAPQEKPQNATCREQPAAGLGPSAALRSARLADAAPAHGTLTLCARKGGEQPHGLRWGTGGPAAPRIWGSESLVLLK